VIVALLLVFGLAVAQEPAAGRVLVHASPGARVVAFPRSEANLIEVGIYGNRVSIPEQLEGRSAPWILDMDAQSIGGGTTFLTFHTTRDDLRLDWSTRGEDIVFSLRPGSADVVLSSPFPPLDALFGRTLARRAAPAPGRALIPLSGDALTVTAAASAWPLRPPEWQVTGLNGDVSQVLSARSGDPWGDMAAERAVLRAAQNDVTRAAALYAIAERFRDLGLRRDELSYLDRVLEVDGPWDRSTLYLRRASALIAVRRYDEARGSCRAAWTTGRAQVTDALVCVGLVSLATSEPPPSEAGRALARASNVPEHRLLAAELLLLDNRSAEALELLEGLPATLDGPLQRLAYANIGDARYAVGDAEGAELAWRDAGYQGELGRVLSLRIRMMHMTQQLAPTWAAELPYLRSVSEGKGAAAAEALFLIAQIAKAYDDPELAIYELAQLHDRFPELSRRSDVPATLHDQCVARLDQLDREGRQAALVATYRDCWRTSFRELAVPTGPLDDVARALVRMGLPDEALKVHLEAMALETLRGELALDRLVALTRLYLETERPQEALDTITYARRGAAKDTPVMALLRGEALVALERPDDALAAWALAERAPGAAAEARVRSALLRVERGDCEGGMPVLQAMAERPWAILDVPADRVHLARARCLLAAGDPAGAIAAASAATREAADPWVAENAATLASAAATSSGLDGIPADLGPAPPIWQRLMQEERNAAAFSQALAERRR